MAAVMLFLLGKDRKTEHYTHFCMPLEPVFTRDCGSGVHFIDEPINGLDPKNISELRSLLKRLNEENDVTLLLSSHILNELYLLATDYYIIHKGKIIESLTHDELDEKCRQYIKIKTSQLPKCITVIESEFNDAEYSCPDDETLHLFSHTDRAESIAKLLMENHIVTKEFSVTEQSLEEYFLGITGGDSNA